MKITGRVEVLVIFFLVVRTGAGAGDFELQPSYGDVTVSDSAVVSISLSSDFKYNASSVYSICGVSNRDNIGYILSRQFGYQKDGCHFLNREVEPAMMAISCANCIGTESHVLRCCDTTPISCNEVLVLESQCTGSKRQTKSGVNPSYPGEALLFPPTYELNDNSPTSYSMGLVAIRKECQDSNEWRFIRKDTDTVSMDVVNTLCRQMGFTYGNPGFVVTLEEAEELYGYDFSYWSNIRRYSHISLSDIQCSRSQRCLGCCNYNIYPANKCADKDEMHESSVVDDSQFLVIHCSFYRDQYMPPSGDKECSVISTIRDRSICYPSTHFEDVRLQNTNFNKKTSTQGQLDTPTEGRLEFFKNYQWHTVCVADFDKTEADIACRMLGFSSAAKFEKHQGNDTDEQTSSRGLPLRLSCSDDYTTSKCSFAVNNCNHSQDVDVWCEKSRDTAYYLQVYVLPGGLGIIVLILAICTILLCLKCYRNRRGRDGYQNLENQGRGCLACFKKAPQNEDEQQHPNPQND